MEPEEYIKRALEAERLLKQSHSEKEKRKWLKTRCPFCKYEIQYVPKKDWKGKLRCPECGKTFKVGRLDDFIEQ